MSGQGQSKYPGTIHAGDKAISFLSGLDLAGLDDICIYEISVLFTWNACICKVFRSMWKQKDPGELLLQGLIFCWGGIIIFAPNGIMMIALKQMLSWGKDVYPVWGKVVYPLAGQDLAGLDDICTYEISVLFTWDACICKVFRYVWIQKDPGESLLQGLIFCWGGDNHFYPKRDNDDCPATNACRGANTFILFGAKLSILWQVRILPG